MTNISDFTGWRWGKDWSDMPTLFKYFETEANGRRVKVEVEITSSLVAYDDGTYTKLDAPRYSEKFNHPAYGAEDMVFTLAFLSMYQQAVYETTAILAALKS